MRSLYSRKVQVAVLVFVMIIFMLTILTNMFVVDDVQNVIINHSYQSYSYGNGMAWQQYITKPANASNINVLNGPTGRAGSEWSMCTHFKRKRHELFDMGLATFISYKFKPRNGLDFGAGLGLYIDFMAQFYHRNGNNDGVFIGIEPENMLEAGIYGRYSHQISLNIADNYTVVSQIIEALPRVDVVTSFEVLEHIPFKYHDIVIPLLVSKCLEYLVFSAAKPGQGGNGHLSESMFTKTEWIQKFTKKGLIHLPNLSRIITTKFCRKSWFKQNIFIMANKQFINDNDGIDNVDQCNQQCIEEIVNSQLQLINDSKQKIIRENGQTYSTYSTKSDIAIQNLIFVTQNIWPIYWSRFTSSTLCKH